jgi:hypothetical protein
MKCSQSITTRNHANIKKYGTPNEIHMQRHARVSGEAYQKVPAIGEEQHLGQAAHSL